jgi:hypothetical protein
LPPAKRILVNILAVPLMAGIVVLKISFSLLWVGIGLVMIGFSGLSISVIKGQVEAQEDKK